MHRLIIEKAFGVKMFDLYVDNGADHLTVIMYSV